VDGMTMEGVGTAVYTTSDVKVYWTVDYSKDNSPPSALRAVPQGVAQGPYQPVPVVCSAYGFCSPWASTTLRRNLTA